MDMLPLAVDDILVHVLDDLKALFRLHRSQAGERNTFARCMNDVASELQGIRGGVPQHAEPVARELAALVATIACKATSHAARASSAGAWDDCIEAERMHVCLQGIQRLLPLLTVSSGAAAGVSAAVADLHRRAASLRASSAEAAASLSHLSATVDTLAASTSNAAEVQQCMAAMHASMMQMHEQSAEQVLEAFAALHVQLGRGQDGGRNSADMLRRTLDEVSSRRLALRASLAANLQQVSSSLAVSCGGAGVAADCMQPMRVMQAIDAVIDARDGAAPPDSNEAWAAAIHAAALEGRLPISACLVLGVPLMREGPLRPVTLPCCHLAVSRAGAQRLMDKRWCQMCKSPWPTGGELRDNEPMTMAVALEASGFLPHIFRQAEVTIRPDADTNRNNPSGWEGDGKEVKGTVQGGVVAVKQIPLPNHAERVGMVGVKQVIASAFAAALRSRYMRRVHGYCLAGSEIWVVMEPCEGSLVDLVNRAKQQGSTCGLPPVDTVALGIMLCAALDAVHRSAQHPHLDLTPRTVLLAVAAGTPEGGAYEARSVRLSEVVTSKHIPQCARLILPKRAAMPWDSDSEETGFGAGYLPREQLRGAADASSDVYSLGATLLYAATGAHPYGNESSESILCKVISGEPIKVPEDLKPASLRSLLTAMMAVEVGARPALAEVQQRLLAIHATLLSHHATNRFIAPIGRPQPAPCLRSHAITLSAESFHSVSGSGSCASCSTDVGLGDGADERPSSGCATACETAAGEEDASTERDAPSTSEASEHVVGLNRRHSSVAGAVDGQDTSLLESQNANGTGIAAEDSRSEAPGNSGDGLYERSSEENGRQDVSSDMPPAVPWTAPATETSSPSSAGVGGNACGPELPGGTDAGGHSDDSAGEEEVVMEDVAGIRNVRILFDRLEACPLNKTHTFDFHRAKLRLNSRIYIANFKCELTEGSGVVANAHLDLGAEGRMVLSGCSRVEFRNVVIKGGTLVCEGQHCRLTLRDVTLECCQLVVSKSAAARLRGVTMRGCPPQNSSVLCYVSGAGTAVHARDAAVAGTVAVQSGAEFTGQEVHVKLVRDTAPGVWAKGEGTEVTLTRCSISRSPDATVGEACTRGVCVQGDATVSLSDCRVTRVVRGVQVDKGAHASMRDTAVSADGDALWVKGRVEAVGCRLSGHGAAVAAATAATTSFERCEMGITRKFDG